MLAQLTSPNGIFSQLGVLVEENPPRPCSKLSKRTQPCKMAKFGKSSMGHGFHGFHGYVTNINKLPEGNPSFLGIANTSRTDQVWKYENPPASFRSSHHPPPKAPPWGHLTSMTLARHSPISTGYQLFLQPDHQKKYHKMSISTTHHPIFRTKIPQKNGCWMAPADGLPPLPHLAEIVWQLPQRHRRFHTRWPWDPVECFNMVQRCWGSYIGA